jgi:PKD repeat protein
MLNLRNILLLTAIIGIAGCKKKGNDEITPTPTAPVASFSFHLSPTNHAPSTATFTNLSTNATSYSWNFGDGSPASTSTDPTHTYTAAGTYTVTLTSTGTGGNNTVSTTVQILSPITIAKITKISLTQYPTRDSAGNPWDISNGPDIYFKIYKNDTAHIAADFTAMVDTDVTASTVTITPAAFQVFFSDTMYIAAFDKESTGPDTVMGKRVQPLVGFKIGDYTLSYPDSINIASSSDSLKFTIHLIWQ